MTKCYIQFFDESGNHSNPYPDDYETCDSLASAQYAFESWADEVGRYADPHQASALVFIGKPEGMYPCDTYPDFIFYIGPRGGINRSRA